MNLKKLIVLGGVGLLSAVAGIAIPQMMNGQSHSAADAPPTDAAHGKEAPGHDKKEKKPAAKADDHGAAAHGSSGHGASGHGDGKGDAEKVKVDGPCFILYGRMVVNLNDPNLTKYLSLEVTVQVDANDEDDVKGAIDSRKPILQTWLTGHLADKTIEDVRGKVGVNRLRREIQDNFNALLFTDGRERIQDILFEEFHIQ